MWRLRVSWSGSGVVGPGLSTWYALDTSPGFPAAVRAFYAALASNLPTSVSVSVPNNGDVLDPATGALTGTWTDGSVPAVVNGSGAGTFALGVGVQVRWSTGSIVSGRRVVGSTFIVPVVSPVFDSDGTITTATMTGLRTASANLITAAPYLVVWSRPQPARTGAHGPLPARAGSTALIGGSSWPDRPSWLTSRRR